MKRGFIMTMLGMALPLTAVATLFRQRTDAYGQSLRGAAPEVVKRAQPALTVVPGALLGFLVMLTSVGNGALCTVMLLYLYPVRMKPALRVDTDIVHAIPLTIVAGTGHLLMGNVDLALLGNLRLGSIPGISIGSMIGSRTPEAWLRASIAVVLAAVGIKLLMS